MTMTINVVDAKEKLGDVYDAYKAMKNVANAPTKDLKKIDLDTGWAMDDILDALQSNFERREKKTIELAKDLGDADPKRFGIYKIRSENLDKYGKELEKLDAVMVPIHFVPLNFDDLNEAGIIMNSDDLRPLRKIGIVTRTEVKEPKREDPNAPPP
ncbi:hypothetical protein LCGC14_0337050 [marine sediment metagenome]|uniref:Uncharacterized protein n=1 Tax=marine sediment metagenome TaxID=412755 RepID=A0A0F9WM47_9ZZZZ